MAEPDDRLNLSSVPEQESPRTDQPMSETRRSSSSAVPPSEERSADLARPADIHDPLSALGQTLIELQIINPQQWTDVRARTGNVNDIEAVLEAFRHSPSARKSRLEPNLPALTAYQASVIRDKRPQDLRLGSYLFIDRVGAGGMGEVFKAWNLNLDRIEAIKVVTHADVTGSTIGMARFDREARVLAQLDHPNITTIYNTGREGNTAYIAMEFVHGRTLLDVVREAKRKEERVPEGWALEAMREVASALEHAHQLGIIHRDIKPNNIMITSNGDVRVLDMGIARLLDPTNQQNNSHLTRQVAGLGTPEVMPPEQWADASSVSPASDIYSLGCTLYYLLLGRMPFWSDTLHGLMSAHLTTPPDSVRAARPELSPFCDALLERMLAKDPRDRFQTCSELVRAIDEQKLEQIPARPSTHRPTPQIPASNPTPDASKPRSKATVWLLLASLVAVAGLTAGTAYYLVATQKNYSHLKESWTVEFQQAHLDAWPTIESLRAALQKEAPPKVDSDATFDEFKQWLEVRTEDQNRHRREFFNWASSLQEQKSKIWRTPDELLAFCKADLATVSSKADIDTVRRMVEDETARREAIRAKARTLLTSLEEKNKELFNGAGEIEAIASKVVPIDELTDEKDIDRIKEAVELAAKERYQGKVDSQLNSIQTDFADVWKNKEAIRTHLGRKGDPSRPSNGNIKEMREELLHESWRRKANYWLTDFQEDRSSLWKSAAELIAFVDERFPKEIEDEEAFKQMQQAVEKETRERLKSTLATWSKAFATDYPSLGPAIDLASNPFTGSQEEDFAGDEGRDEFDEVLFARARQRIENAQISLTGNPRTDFQNKHLLRLIYWLAGLSVDEHEPSGKTEVSMELEGRPIDVVPLNTKATLTLQSSIPGYVTVIVLESTGRVFAFEWDQPIVANQKINVVRFDSTSPGEDQILCFVTATNPRDSLPKPPADLSIKPVSVPAGFLEKFILPPVLTERTDVDRIRESLPTPSVWDELLAGLTDDAAPDYVPAHPTPGNWAKASIKVRWDGTK